MYILWQEAENEVSLVNTANSAVSYTDDMLRVTGLVPLSKRYEDTKEGLARFNDIAAALVYSEANPGKLSVYDARKAVGYWKPKKAAQAKPKDSGTE